jgi:hypothetical protein
MWGLAARAAAWPIVARAQQGDRMRRIGVLMTGDENDPLYKSPVSAFTQALADLAPRRAFATRRHCWAPARALYRNRQWRDRGRMRDVVQSAPFEMILTETLG